MSESYVTLRAEDLWFFLSLANNALVPFANSGSHEMAQAACKRMAAISHLAIALNERRAIEIVYDNKTE